MKKVSLDRKIFLIMSDLSAARLGHYAETEPDWNCAIVAAGVLLAAVAVR